MSHFVDMVCSHCRTRVTETHTRAKHSKQREQDWLVSLSKLYDTSKNVCFFSSNYHGLCLNVSRTRSEEHNCRHEIPSWWLTLEKEHDSSYSHTSLSNAEQCQEVGQRKTVTAPMAKFLSTIFFYPVLFLEPLVYVFHRKCYNIMIRLGSSS